MDAGDRVGLRLETLERRLLLNATVTDASILAVISTDAGVAGVAGIGDVITVTWNNGPAGDNNPALVGSPTADMTQFGGGAAVVMVDDGTAGDGAAGDNIWGAQFTVVAGAVDAANLNASVTAANPGGPTTTFDTSNLSVDSVAPTVTDGNIAAAITTDNNVGGVAGITDVITVTWGNGGAGDNNADIASAAADLSAFGGGAAVAMVDDGTAGDGGAGDGVWGAQFTVVAGAIDATNLNAGVTATDDAGNAITTADTSNLSVDSVAPAVTDPNILAAITTDGVVVGVANIGDVITVVWDNGGAGDNNADLASVTADLSAFGGGAAVAMLDDGLSGDGAAGDGLWGTQFTIVDGTVDATDLNASVTATDDAGNATTTADTSNLSVDSIRPDVRDATVTAVIQVDGRTGGVADINDVIRVTWSSGEATAEMTSVTVNLSAFEGPAAGAMFDDATNGDQIAGDGVWTLDYTVRAGNLINLVRNVTVTAVDNAGNVGASADTSNITVDNGPEATITSGGSTVLIYDVAGPVDVDPAKVLIRFGQADGVTKVRLTGTDAMGGLGLVISGAPKIEPIKDMRKGTPGAIAFIAADTWMEGISLKTGMNGYNLNGLTLGGFAFAADIDGDGSMTDTQVLWGSGGAGKVKLGGQVSGDVRLAAGSRALSDLKIKGGGYSGDMILLGDVGSIKIIGGDLGSSIQVSGDLNKLSIKARKGVGGILRAGSNVSVTGLLKSGKIGGYETDNGSVSFGLRMFTLGSLKAGSVKLRDGDLPFVDGDFEVARIVI